MRLRRLAPGQASTRHRHRGEHELYVRLEGTGRIRVDGELLTLQPLTALWVEPEGIRQCPTTPMPPRRRRSPARRPRPPHAGDDPGAAGVEYPDGPKAPPPELDG